MIYKYLQFFKKKEITKMAENYIKTSKNGLKTMKKPLKMNEIKKGEN